MRHGFYWKLAASGISKNRRLYLPFLLTCSGMVMIFYLLLYLSTDRDISRMGGGGNIQLVLAFGSIVMAMFALIFLFYTNSFLIRRRKMEFGLYNVLGMGKRELGRVLLRETLLMGVISLAAGLACGILFSLLAKLIMSRILGWEGSVPFSVAALPAVAAMVVFGAIFICIFLRGLRQIFASSPVELMHSEQHGEKPPKANWFVALLGLVLLGIGYSLAILCPSAAIAILLFFVAVLFVIGGTFLLFRAGSVTLCRLLQKNKSYYYRTDHFISTSSMAWRMKRSGSGLASICILCTMVLVTLFSTVSLFVSREDSLRRSHPRNLEITLHSYDTEENRRLWAITDQVLEEHGMTPENEVRCRFIRTGGYLMEDGTILLDRIDLTPQEAADTSRYTNVTTILREDYAVLTGDETPLAHGEVLVYSEQGTPHDTLTIQDFDQARVVGTAVEDLSPISAASYIGNTPVVYVVVADLETLESYYEYQLSVFGESFSSDRRYYRGFDLSCDFDEQQAIYDEIEDRMGDLASDMYARTGKNLTITLSSAATDRGEFYGTYGGLFFLGILLGGVFLASAVLIMYYKQLIEGYEDQARFGILQKVGMTREEIRKSVNAQLRTVFFLPLGATGLHIVAAFHLISLLLSCFGLNNIPLQAVTAAISFVVLGAFYILVYRATSKAYYGIVSNAEA